MVRDTYLLLPAFKLIHKKVVPLSDFGKLAIHPTLEIDKILPCFHGISRVLIAFPDDFVEMAHGDLRHQWLLDRAVKDSLHTSVTALQLFISLSHFSLSKLVSTYKLFADMVHNAHYTILVPPGRILNAFNFSSHDNYLTSRDQLATAISGS